MRRSAPSPPPHTHTQAGRIIASMHVTMYSLCQHTYTDNTPDPPYLLL